MLARQRQEVILEETLRTGAVRVSELVSRLGVSDMTIRRDLDALAGRGLVEKVYGGATAARPSGHDGVTHGGTHDVARDVAHGAGLSPGALPSGGRTRL
ncbi:DeoR family transcriptional regulator, partial [Saccharomonospora iraqiensis]|uniref:DeoR family transcriptional regulator n=1 Tax=Saccharomonospora iraqiensis TaxID=52698 RepID=UPI001F2AFC15